MNETAPYFHLYRPDEIAFVDLHTGDNVLIGRIVLHFVGDNQYYITGQGYDENWFASTEELQRLAEWIMK